MTPRETRVAVPLLAGVIASFAMLWHGLQLQQRADAPMALRTFIQAGAPHAAVIQARALHLLDGAGQRIARQPIAALGLSEEPNDMDWTVDAAGRTEAWFFEDAPPRVVRCVFDAAVRALAGCKTQLQGAQLKANPDSRAVHLAVDAPRERIYIADAQGHAVRAFGFDGTLQGATPDGLLLFPNRLRLSGDQLVVADNDHRRLVWLEIAGTRPSFLNARTLNVSSHPQARGDRQRAADVAFVSDAAGQVRHLWLLALAQGQKQGDALIWGPGLRPAGRADLGGHGDPLVIDTLGDTALIADFAGIALYRVDAVGRYLGEFGQGEFGAELVAARQTMRHGQAWARAGWISFAVTLVVGFLLAWRFGEKPGQAQARAAFAELEGVAADVPLHKLELKPQPWYRRQLLAAVFAMGLLPVAAGGVLLMLWRDALPPGAMTASRMGLLAAALAVLLLGYAFTIVSLLRQGARRLVLHRGEAHVMSGRRILARAPVLEVTASPLALVIGRVTLPYRAPGLGGRPGRWIFDQDAISRYLLAHLPPAQRVATADLGRLRWQRLPRWQKVLLVTSVAAWGAFELWRLFGRAS